MSRSGPVIQLAVCGVCERNRFQVPTLIELRPGRCICTFCLRTALETLVTHYGSHDIVVSPSDPAPVPA